jgi:hypothetical protein
MILAVSLGGAILTTGVAAEVPKEINACTMLTDAEVGAALGTPVEPGLRRDSGVTPDGAYSSTCLWRVSADKDAKDPKRPLGGARFAILNAMAWSKSSKGPASFLQSFRDAARDHTIDKTPVALKIGDESLWWGDGVAVRKGDMSFGMSVHLVTERERERGLSEGLAAKVLKRL